MTTKFGDEVALADAIFKAMAADELWIRRARGIPDLIPQIHLVLKGQAHIALKEVFGEIMSGEVAELRDLDPAEFFLGDRNIFCADVNRDFVTGEIGDPAVFTAIPNATWHVPALSFSYADVETPKSWEQTVDAFERQDISPDLEKMPQRLGLIAALVTAHKIGLTNYLLLDGRPNQFFRKHDDHWSVVTVTRHYRDSHNQKDPYWGMRAAAFTRDNCIELQAAEGAVHHGARVFWL